jgi:hypothetical protein
LFQQLKGVFQGPFVLCTFAAHLNAIRGYMKIKGLTSVQKLEQGSLVLSAVLVCVKLPNAIIYPANILISRYNLH